MAEAILEVFPECVNSIAAKNSTQTTNFEIDVNDLLENIYLLLNYIKKSKKSEDRNDKIKSMTSEEFVKNNLGRHKLFTLGTSNSEGNPWVVCLNLSCDNNLNIIWKSDKNTVHSKNLSENPNVSICIFSDEPGVGDFGFYSKAIAHEVVDEKELANCLDVRFRQKGKDVPPMEDFLGDSDFRIYVAEIKEAWVTDQSHTKNKLDLESLRNILK